MANISIQTTGGGPGGNPGIPLPGDEEEVTPTTLSRIAALESAVAALQAANVAFLAQAFADEIAALEAADTAFAAADTVLAADVAAIEGDVAALESADVVIAADVAVLESWAALGDPDAFLGFGPSDNIKNQREQGYDRANDNLLGGSGIFIENYTDKPNVWFRRRENYPSSTGFSNSTALGGIGAAPMHKTVDGQYIFDNGSDGEVAQITFRFILASDGATLIGATSSIAFELIDSRSSDPSPAPFPVLTISGEGGGRVTASGYNASGVLESLVLFQPST